MVTRSKLFFLLLFVLGLWLFSVAVVGHARNLRAREFVSQEILRSEEWIAAELGIEITETFYTKNVFVTKGEAIRLVLRRLDPTYWIGYLIYRLCFQGKPLSNVEVKYVIPEELPRGNTL